MSREIVFLSWCDRCEMQGRERVPAEVTYTIGIVRNENRPAPRVVEMCLECATTLDELAELLNSHSIPLDTKSLAKGPAAPSRPAATPAPSVDRGRERVNCRVCGVDLARSSEITHIWQVHRSDERPQQPTRCPTCKASFPSGGVSMAMHRTRLHGYSALEEAYSGAALQLTAEPSTNGSSS